MKFFLIIMIMAACLLFPGCGQNQNISVKEEELIPPQTTVLEFYSWQDEQKYMTQAIDAFMKENPDIRVNCHFIPTSEYGQTISILHNTNEKAIDLFAESKPTVSAADIKKNYVLDITELYTEKENTPISYQEMLNKLKIDDRLYMLPYRKSTWAVYYNKDLFDQAGIPYPKDTWTWTEYTELARRLTDTKDGRKTFGSISFEVDSMWWRTPARTAGIENEMTEESLYYFKEAALWNYKMAYEYQAQPAYTDLTDVSSYDYASRFLNGDIAMLYCGDWMIEILAQQIKTKGIPFSYDIAPLPGMETGNCYMPVTTALLQISSKSKHPREALQLAEYLAGEEGARILAECGIQPAWDTMQIRQLLQNSDFAPEHIEYFLDYDMAVYTMPDERMEEALKVINHYVGQYLMKEMDLETAFKNIESSLQERRLIQNNE